MAGIELRSTAFNDQTPIPDRYTKDGENLSPPLDWSRPPPGTRELALLCEDPDAPSGTFLHWLVTGIDPASGGVAVGEPPRGGTPHTNGFGDRGWDGPRPPVGDRAHRYFFRLYALPEHVELPEHATAADAHRMLDGRSLAGGTLRGLYQRRDQR
ncbi:YbhB/YbcL family Raf kinase inhibitor-like protein [Streptomyces specialis]|uniref:YbhB/YbcL family Raf kinase inhibitor-like protein n=1 Tax=Streptomyces specialis TaxID=498367 RepID=UPI00073EB5E0|nr:YbhB/YbcL family Raf kinase inhibitor-like protein [Streptomyces specialis]